MARVRYPDDPEATEITARSAVEARETEAYTIDGRLYGPFVEGIGEEAESATTHAVAEEPERAAQEAANITGMGLYTEGWEPSA
jgi:hypothetical protein